MEAERTKAIASGSFEGSFEVSAGSFVQGDLKMQIDDKQNYVSTQQLNLN